MIRLRDWQSRFQAFLAERRDMPFAWGTNDCAIFAADDVLAITGVETAVDLRSHRNGKEATVHLRALGGLAKIAEDRLGPSINSLLAQVGDVGLLELENRHTLVVCGGDHWIAPGEKGLNRVSMNRVAKAWRVG